MMFADSCLQVVRVGRGSTTAAGLARHLLQTAYAISRERRRITPYSLAASDEFDMVYNGGKEDDVTVVVAFVDAAAAAATPLTA